MIAPRYRAQVDLLLRALPAVAIEPAFALKGGTAINLFIRNMPRLSVDIDLTYLPFDTRDDALTAISAGLTRTKIQLERIIPSVAVRPLGPRADETKLLCTLQGATIKIEVNTVTRGHLWPPQTLQLVQKVQDEFQKFAAMQVVSPAELFGGKICAALDRQHPRDLFDIHQLLESEGFTDAIRYGFIAALLSHSRPINELLSPRFQDQQNVFEAQFAEMAVEPFDYATYSTTLQRLADEIQRRLTDVDRAFLLSFKDTEPDWLLFPHHDLHRLPAIQWKLANIRTLKSQSPEKHAKQLDALKRSLGC